jgi:hypothetical protein
MKDVFQAAGVEVTKENKKQIDRIVRDLVHVAFKGCSPTWKAVKAHIKGDKASRDPFVETKNAARKRLELNETNGLPMASCRRAQLVLRFPFDG